MYSYIVLALCERPICHNSISATGRLFSIAESRTPDPLNKSQIQSRPERNIDKKAQPFRRPLAFFFDDGRCMFCSGSGTNKHSRGQKTKKIGPQFAGSLCRY